MFHKASVFNIHIIPERIFFSHFIVEKTEDQSQSVTSLSEKRTEENKYLPSIHSIIGATLNQDTS